MVADLATRPGADSWREAALQRGHRSPVAVPRRSDGTPVGALAGHGPEPAWVGLRPVALAHMPAGAAAAPTSGEQLPR